MLYYFFEFLDRLNFPGAGLFDFISFRASMALIASLLVSIVIGKRMIQGLRKQQILGWQDNSKNLVRLPWVA
jgi:phospho-N-acetylmuramoyl-pentapeptide-transferase